MEEKRICYLKKHFMNKVSLSGKRVAIKNGKTWRKEIEPESRFQILEAAIINPSFTNWQMNRLLLPPKRVPGVFFAVFTNYFEVLNIAKILSPNDKEMYIRHDPCMFSANITKMKHTKRRYCTFSLNSTKGLQVKTV